MLLFYNMQCNTDLDDSGIRKLYFEFDMESWKWSGSDGPFG
jgi:hypothetical protein